jgi:hypothetical protein
VSFYGRSDVVPHAELPEIGFAPVALLIIVVPDLLEMFSQWT